MPEINFKNKRSKLILTLKWNNPKDIIAWVKGIVASGGADFGNIDSAIPVVIPSVIEEKKETVSFTKEQVVSIALGETAIRPVLDWKKITSDSFNGRAKRNVELPEFMAKYKANYKQENLIGKL